MWFNYCVPRAFVSSHTLSIWRTIKGTIDDHGLLHYQNSLTYGWPLPLLQRIMYLRPGFVVVIVGCTLTGLSTVRTHVPLIFAH